MSERENGMNKQEIVEEIEQIESNLFMRERAKRFEQIAKLQEEIKVLNTRLVEDDARIAQLTKMYGELK